MTSRFYAADASDSDSETSSSEDELISKPVVTQRKFQWSDDEEETKRIVRSAKDKRWEELNNHIKDIKNHKKIKDMPKVLQDFEDLCKAYEKSKKVVEKEGIPRFYIKCLAELEDFINECWEDREGRKNMSKNNARGLTALRQKLRKYNRDFETHITGYREKPDEEDEEGEAKEDEEDEEEEDEEEEAPSADFFKKAAPVTKKTTFKDDDMDDDDSDSDWGSDSDSESSSEDDIIIDGKLGPEIFRKKAPGEEKKDKKEKEKKREERRRKRAMEDDEDEDQEGEWTTIKGGAPLTSERPKMFSKDAEINHEAVAKKLIEITSARGKKATDRNTQIEMLIELRSIAKAHNLGPAMDIKVMFNIVSAIFDYNSNIATCMKGDMWEKCEDHVGELLAQLMEHKEIMVAANVLEESETYTGDNPRLRGCILTVIERLDEEFIKMLQGCDAHSTEYVERLKDERLVCKIINDLQTYLEGSATTEELCRVYLKKIEHMYYKFDKRSRRLLPGEEPNPDLLEEPEQPEPPKVEVKIVDAKPTPPTPTENGTTESTTEDATTTTTTTTTPTTTIPTIITTGEETKVEETKPELTAAEIRKKEVENFPIVEGGSEAKMEKFCKFIYAKDNTDRIRTRAMLCHIYHHALHDRWYEARDLMLMSHLQDTIEHADIPTQIMYNRAMVQLGLCAFRQGMITDSHNCLVDIQSGGRAKELLAQGLLLQRQHERTPEQEKIEKRRQMPYHMHINLELLECVYLVSAMLMEIPYMAAHEFDARRRMISKNFHHVMRVSERQPLVGPPESMREHVVAASKAMKNGNWKACRDFIINDKMNGKVWDLFYQKLRVLSMMEQKIKEESLRTYLFTYSQVYDSLSLIILSEMFELEKPIVHSTISKMIINEELMASLDEPTQAVVMHRTEPTRHQSLALQLAEKVATLVDNNDRIMEMKQGYFFQKQGYRRDGGDRDGYRRGGGRGGYGGDRNNYRQNRSGGYGGGGYRGNRDRDNMSGGGGYRGNRDRDNMSGGGGYRGNRDRDNRDHRDRRDQRDRGDDNYRGSHRSNYRY